MYFLETGGVEVGSLDRRPYYPSVVKNQGPGCYPHRGHGTRDYVTVGRVIYSWPGLPFEVWRTFP